MKTMRNRVNRETSPAAGGLRRWINYLIALVLAAGAGLGAHMAFADTATPAGDGFTATSSNVSLKLGIVTVTCTGASMKSTVPVPPNNPTPAGLPVCGPITIPTFTGCSATGGTVTFDATLTANGSWSYCLSNAGPTGQLIIPKNSIDIVAGPCSATVTPNGSVTISGTWTNGTSATSPNPANPPSKVAFTNVSVPLKTTGGFPCPAATSGSLSATFEVVDTTNASAAITIGP